jgi:hypothetical protein
MRQTRDEITENLADRLCGGVARRDDARVARRLGRKQVVDRVYRLDEGAVLDDFFHFLNRIGVMALLAEVRGTTIQREMVPVVQYVLLCGLKTLFGIESMNALLPGLFSYEALMSLVGFNVQQGHDGVCQRGATLRQGERPPGPICPDTVAKNSVKWDLWQLEAGFNGAIRALAQAAVFGAKVSGMADGTDLGTTAHYRGCGQATGKVRVEEKHGQRHETEVTVYGGKVLLLIEAATTSPLAVKVGQLQEHETHWTRALIPQASTDLAGAVREHKVVFEKGFLAGTDLWWLDQSGIRFVVPAKANMVVTAYTRAQAAAGEGLTLGRLVHTVRHGQGKTA